MSTFIRQFWIHLVVAVLAIAGVVFASEKASQNRVVLAESYEDSDLELQGKKLKGFALGSEGMLADWYWIRSLQYIGDKLVKNDLSNLNIENLRPLNPRLLYPLLDNATDLDPKFLAAYSYGAVVLPAIDVASAVALTEKGIANNPDAWRLYHYLGYIYWRNKDYENAARSYDRGSAVAGSPPFMREMAASMRTRGGTRDTAYELYSQILAAADDPQSKSNAEIRLKQIDALDDIDAVNEVLSGIRERTGRCPLRVAGIFPSLQNVKLPRDRQFLITKSNDLADPTGIPYAFDATECQISISPESKIPLQ